MMGFTGDDGDEALVPSPGRLKPLNVDSDEVSDASSMEDTTSPLNFSVLFCDDTLRVILEKLPIVDLARAACVCRLWRLVASDREMQVRAFMSPWKIRDVIGYPSSSSFWRDNSLWKFAVSHRLSRGDSIASLALKYSVQVMDIKRLNNMISDHGIYSRDRLLIPVRKPEILINSTCFIEVDSYAKREVAVLYLEGNRPEVNSWNCVATERGKRRVLDSLKRSMRVDDGTAQYYLSISNGNPRAALAQFSEDLIWERQSSSSSSSLESISTSWNRSMEHFIHLTGHNPQLW